MRQVGWKSTWKSDAIEEAQPNLSGLVPTVPLSHGTTLYFTHLEPLECLVITSAFNMSGLLFEVSEDS